MMTECEARLLRNQIYTSLKGGIYNLKKIALHTNLSAETIRKLSRGVGNPGPEVLERVAEWLRGPRDLRAKFPNVVKGRPAYRHHRAGESRPIV
jgi:hypothetical protein